VNVLGLGTAVPPHRMSQPAALAMCADVVTREARQRRFLRVLFHESGVEHRHTILPEGFGYEWVGGERGANVPDDAAEHPGPTTPERMAIYTEFGTPLARSACERALKDAAVEPREITHLVTVSCTGFEAPGIDVALLRELGLRPTVQRVNVGFMGCHGAINGLRVAHGIAHSQPGATVLLCCIECCTLHGRSTWDRERILCNALFGDGAASLVLRGGGTGRPGGWRVAATGSCLLPDCEEAMTWRIGEHGFEMQLTARVPELIEQHLRPWFEAWLLEQGTSRDAIVHWGVHPGGPRIVDAVERSLGLDGEATAVSRGVLAEFGNMSSPTVLFVFDRFSPPRGPCLLLGFGPGLVAEAALLWPMGG
jgi:predicted naringenin-chalcone synthase